mgnify:CR=1 FL=1
MLLLDRVTPVPCENVIGLDNVIPKAAGGVAPGDDTAVSLIAVSSRNCSALPVLCDYRVDILTKYDSFGCQKLFCC